MVSCPFSSTLYHLPLSRSSVQYISRSRFPAVMIFLPLEILSLNQANVEPTSIEMHNSKARPLWRSDVFVFFIFCNPPSNIAISAIKRHKGDSLCPLIAAYPRRDRTDFQLLELVTSQVEVNFIVKAKTNRLSILRSVTIVVDIQS